MTKYFLDTEFIEDGKTIDLVSIGIVSEDGQELYLGNRECEFYRAYGWVAENVLRPMGFSICTEPKVIIKPKRLST